MCELGSIRFFGVSWLCVCICKHAALRSMDEPDHPLIIPVRALQLKQDAAACKHLVQVSILYHVWICILNSSSFSGEQKSDKTSFGFGNYETRILINLPQNEKDPLIMKTITGCSSIKL